MSDETPERPSPATPPQASDQATQPPQGPPNLGVVPPHVLAQVLGQRVVLGTPFPMLVAPQQQIAQAQLQVWQGQYPPPDAIERYEKVLPGSFNRMIAMAEQLQSAQITESGRVVQYTAAAAKRGHYLGAGTMVVAMACALAALHLGNGWVAGAFLTLPVMGVAKSLVDSARGRADAAQLAQSQPAVPSASVPVSQPQTT